MAVVSIPESIEVFVHAFCEGKSRTYPYVPVKVGGLWVMRDTPDRKNARKIEVITHGMPPEQAVSTLAEAGIGWHFICEVHGVDDDFDGIRAAYKALGYRALSTEWLFVHDLREIPVYESDPPVRLVADEAVLATIKQRGKQPKKLQKGARMFSVWDDDQEYGWVYSVPYGESCWVSNLHVHEIDRGRGYGRALMSALLRSDREHGVKQSVLLASSDGARL